MTWRHWNVAFERGLYTRSIDEWLAVVEAGEFS